jgi:serine/threonine-protein kinase
MSTLVDALQALLKIAALLTALGVVFVMAGYLAVQWSLQAEEFEVPDVKGMDLAQATDVLAEHSLIVEVESQRLTDNEVPEGFVLRQNPLAGTAIKRQRGIRLTLSSGRPLRELPMIVGEAVQRSQIALEQQGVEVEYVARVYSDEFPRDRVIAQQLDRTGLPEGAPVPARLLVSLGSRPTAYIMPDLAYRDGDIVRRQLERLGFRVQVRDARTRVPGQPPGTVIYQQPPQGFKVVQGDSIVLEVNH